MPLVLVTGANGFVGRHVCAALAERGADVRASVRRPGSAPLGEERVGDVADPVKAQEVVAGIDAVVTTVHPMAADLDTQRRIGVAGTTMLARTAAEANVQRFVHVSTTAVYDRRPHVGDIAEDAALVPDDAGPYAVSKREADQALASVEGLTRLLVRPSAVLGPGESSVWNTVRPAAMAADAAERHAVADQSFPWVHVTDLAALLADLALGAIPMTDDPGQGPVAAAWTPVNAATGVATHRDYWTTVCRTLGVDPIWDDAPAWTGRIVADRARAWGWAPRVDLTAALAELEAGLRP